jgi:hypothetical protein
MKLSLIFAVPEVPSGSLLGPFIGDSERAGKA